jgi:DNA repair protein RadA/Sms
VFGEVGLTGEVCAVSQAEKRVAEAIKTGFKTVVLPAKNMRSCQKYQDKINLVPVSFVWQMIKELDLRAPKLSSEQPF